MFTEVRKWLWAKREGIRQSRQLATVPKKDFCVDRLRWLGQNDIREAMSSPEITAEWEQARDGIGRSVKIADGISGGVNPGDRRALWHFAAWMRPTRVLEIGTNVGASTCHLAAALKRYSNGGVPACSITTVDIVDVNDGADTYWKKFGLERSPREALSTMGCDGLVKFVVADSVNFMNSSTQTYDLIFLDGDHTAFKVYEEVSAALRLLNPSGLVLLHDYFPNNRPLWNDRSVVPGPHLAVSRMAREGARLQVLPFGSLPWPTKLGSHTTSLAVVARGNV